MFDIFGDHHTQRDAVIETEAARIDDMLEKIREAPN